MYDAIVVGARCAGSSTAMLLARQGYRVLVVDRATFPSDTISGHFIWHWGAVRLKRWGLLDAVLAAGTPPITKMSSHFGDFILTGDVAAVEDTPFAIAPRRTVLDKILVDAAREAGAEVREGFVVDRLIIEDDVVKGIEGREQGGNKVREFAQIVIGADGKNSKVARTVQAPAYEEVPALTCWYMSYWGDFQCEGIEMHWQPNRIVLTLPTNDGLTLQAVGWTHAEFHEFRSNIEKNYVDTLLSMPGLADRVPASKRVEDIVGMADVGSFLRKPYGEGWALVGDAGHFKDPTPAYGISDAFCDAELLADALDKGLSDAMPMDAALAEYEAKRNERAIPDHHYVCEQAKLQQGYNQDVMRLRAAIRDNPEATSQFYATRAKLPGSQAFFAPENMQRIFQQAAMRQQTH